MTEPGKAEPNHRTSPLKTEHNRTEPKHHTKRCCISAARHLILGQLILRQLILRHLIFATFDLRHLILDI